MVFHGRLVVGVAFKSVAGQFSGVVGVDDGKRLMHGYIKLNSGAVLMSDDFPDWNGGREAPDPGGFTLHLQVPNATELFAKALANGMPLSVVAGRADLMALLAPTGPVVHSGTYSGHLLSILAARATLQVLDSQGKPQWNCARR